MTSPFLVEACEAYLASMPYTRWERLLARVRPGRRRKTAVRIVEQVEAMSLEGPDTERGGGMTPARPEIERLQAVELRPNDVIVATMTAGGDMEETGEFLTRKFPGHQVIVVQGMDIEVLRPRDPGDAR